MSFLAELHRALDTINTIMLMATDAEKVKEAKYGLEALRDEIDMRIAILDSE
jgi:hypothetical protein